MIDKESEEYIREHIEEYAPDELAHFCLDFSIDFLREWKDRIDFFKMQYNIEEKWKQAAGVCCFEEMEYYKKRMDSIQELAAYYYEQYFGF